MRRAGFALALVFLAAVAPPALAGEYEPGTVPPEAATPVRSSGRVLHAGPGGLQIAIDHARPGDTIRIAPGSYRGDVEIRGASKRGLRLLGDRVTLRGRVRVRDSSAITIEGLRIDGSLELDRVDRYVLERLRVRGSSGAGIGVRRSLGGRIARVLSSGNAGPGIAIAATPDAPRAVRTFVRESTVADNAVGIALSGVRAVTISRVRVLRNAVPIAEDGVADVTLAGCVITPSASPSGRR